ncbi:NDP-sugar synthase [Patescibacteria group bacterium]|nr:NDP-sugar synthase [Patescibacteria group bacterium]MBU4162319.1 NDP-sugar synthase [Patescibacteria group bacterium]
MEAVIMAAGRGERTQPLSSAKQKHLLKVLGKSILEHNLEQLNGLVDTVILVIRPDERCKEIKKIIGRKHKGLKIKYALEQEPLGTADAAKTALPFIGERFLLLNGDDLYSHNDIKKVLEKFPCILVKEVSQPKFFGIVGISNGIVKSFIEKPENSASNLANTGLYYLPKDIFKFSIEKSKRGEYEFTDYIKKFIIKEKLNIQEAEQWIPISFCWHLIEACEALLKKIEGTNQGKIDKNCVVSGNLLIGKGTVVKKGTRIEGPVYIGRNCLIEQNCFIKKFSSIGDRVRIRDGATIDNSIIGDKTEIGPKCFIADSIIGDGSKLGATTTTLNFNEDGQTIKTSAKGKIIDTKRAKLGAVIGDRVITGAGVIISPGKKIWPNKSLVDNQRVVEDIQ